MRIVVASGKGGTGKTTIATSLALVAAEQEFRPLFGLRRGSAQCWIVS